MKLKLKLKYMMKFVNIDIVPACKLVLKACGACVFPLSLLLASPLSQAQSALPANSTPIKIMVGASAGGTTDTMARAMAQALGQQLSKVVLVENKTGAGGNLAADAVAKAPADGLTLLMSFTSHAINASLYPHLPFDPIKDFTPITLVSSSPSILVAHPSLAAGTVAELIELAKKKPGKLNFAIGGVGSSLHLAGDLFKLKSGANIANIPYRGTAPAIQDVLAGQVELMFANIGNAQQYIATGKLKALGVTSSKRLSAFADVPTIAETLPGFESSAWFGLFGPAKLSPELLKRLSEASILAIQTPEVRRRIESEGASPVGNSPQEFAKFLELDIARWREVVKFSGAKPE